MKHCLLFIYFFFFAFAAHPLFSDQHAGKLQNIPAPYFTGPILTPSAENAPPGEFLVEPYIFMTNQFGEFNNSRQSKSTPDLFTLKESLVYQMGLSDFLDFTATFNVEQRWQGSARASGLGDTQIEFGIPLMKEQPNRPALRLTVTESFPTGKYQKLTPGKESLEAMGSGSYETSLAFNVTKAVHWMQLHPMVVRASLQYTIPTSVNVRGPNAYVSDPKAIGRVRPGQSVGIKTSIEVSLTQKLALACDLTYSYQCSSSFSPKTGAREQMPLPSSDTLQCAPAIEYSLSEHIGFLAGVWFTITGRNSPQFVSGVLTMYYSW